MGILIFQSSIHKRQHSLSCSTRHMHNRRRGVTTYMCFITVTLSCSSREGLRLYRLFDILYYSIGYAPANKVELSDCRRQTLKLNALRSTKWVKELLRIAIKARLVGDMYREHLAIRCRVRHVLVLGVVCHKPLKLPKRRPGTSRVPENGMKLLSILRNIEKTRQARQQQISL